MSAAKQINIANLAKLTQLHLLPDDAQKLQQDLQQTLVFIDQVANTNISADARVTNSSAQYLREDTVQDKAAIDSVQEISPEVQAGLFMVPQVVE
jgi:aspartyl/glutamyl-tRNA(Asn/Gln) amidotransferase C subunit